MHMKYCVYRLSIHYYGVSYRLPEYSKVTFPGQVFLPQRTYTTPPVGYLRPYPGDGSEDERSEMKIEENNRDGKIQCKQCTC